MRQHPAFRKRFRMNLAILDNVVHQRKGTDSLQRFGYWRCRDCDKIVDLNLDGEQSRCAECGSPRLKRIVPKPQKPLPLSFEAGRLLFLKMREALHL